MPSDAYAIGDLVRDSEKPDDSNRMVVLGLPGKRAGAYEINDDGTTVADVNGCDSEAFVVEVGYAASTSKDVDNLQRYAFPTSRLERAAPGRLDDTEALEQAMFNRLNDTVGRNDLDWATSETARRVCAEAATVAQAFAKTHRNPEEE